MRWCMRVTGKVREGTELSSEVDDRSSDEKSSYGMEEMELSESDSWGEAEGEGTMEMVGIVRFCGE